MSSKELTHTAITRYRNGQLGEEQSPVVVEAALTFVVNGHETATLLCTPTHLHAFTCGFLFTSGIIRCADDILDWRFNENRCRVDVSVRDFSKSADPGKKVFTSGFGKGVIYTHTTRQMMRHPITANARVSAESLMKSMQWLTQCSNLHKKTGGVHSATISINNAMPEFHIDDIGRHNAVDKVIGTLVTQGMSPDNIMLLGTGRISSEILQKAGMMGIPVIASRGTPTHQAVLEARQMGITVVGFARADNFAIFSHPQRIITP